MDPLQTTSPRAVGELEYTLTRFLMAPREAVFRAWTEPAQLARWWGPHGFSSPQCEIDLRPGGKLLLSMCGPDGVDSPMTGEVLEVSAPERFVFTLDTAQHPDEFHAIVNSYRPASRHRRGFVQHTTVTLEARDGGTWMTIVCRLEDRIDRDAVLDIGAPEGWGQSLDKLDALVVHAEGRTFTLDRLIAAPRERVFAAWNDPVGKAVWWGPDGFTTTTHANDLRPGGQWNYTMHGPDGKDWPNVQQYLEIDPPSRLVYLHGAIPDLANDPEAFQVTVTFAEENGGTRIRMRGILKTVEQFETVMRFGALEGGQQTLARLASHVESH